MRERIPKWRLGALLLIGGLVTGTAQAATWSDSFLGYRYGTQFTEPGNPQLVEKNVLQFTRASGYSLGQHFLKLDLLQSDGTAPAAGVAFLNAIRFY
ncbi:MAG: hypothetical protein ACLFSR_00035 [Halomonas sp.]